MKEQLLIVWHGLKNMKFDALWMCSMYHSEKMIDKKQLKYYFLGIETHLLEKINFPWICKYEKFVNVFWRKTAFHILYETYRIFVGLFMLCSVGRIGEFFRAIEFLSVFAIKRLVSGMGPHVDLPIFRTSKRTVAIFMLQNENSIYYKNGFQDL